MTAAIPEIKTVTPGATPSASLTQEDITRMPKSFTPGAQGLEADTFETKKESHAVRNTIIGLLIAAAAIVGLKHCGFMKVEEGSTKFLDKWIKKPINKLGEWIEWPFVWVKNKFSSGKAAGDATAEGAEAAGAGAQIPQ
ncbi:MAG: hypothetical protein MJ180_03385 [Candidatus Gastranaerophilales bacterium]|nr:hypothetical protein [Candidatus Gastranaerophilales bacterium]